MEAIQWHTDDETASDKLTEQPDHDKVRNQVKNIIKLSSGDLVRIYCGAFDEESQFFREEFERKNPFGKPLKIIGFEKKDNIPVIILEPKHNGYFEKQRIRLDELGLVENPEKGYHPFNALQLLESVSERSD